MNGTSLYEIYQINPLYFDFSCGKTNKKFICTNEKCIDCYKRSFASHEKSIYWDKSNSTSPRNCFLNSAQKYFFMCTCTHIFNAGLSNINGDNWCPYCANQKLCDNLACIICFNKSLASHEVSKMWSALNNTIPRNVFLKSNKKYFLNCDCGHLLNKPPSSLVKGSICAYCTNKQLCSDLNCQMCFNKSFASHAKAQYWSSQNKETPRQVFLQSNKIFLFDCICGHQFPRQPNDITRNYCWCPFCSHHQLCKNPQCVMCFTNSFASSKKAQYWSLVNDKQPRDVFLSSGNNYIFNCECGHSFKATPHNITKGEWCPYCVVPPKLLCDSDQCNTCFNKSFASHEKSLYWSPINKLSPRQLFQGTAKEYFFDCTRGHRFKALLSNITHQTNPTWCPFCRNKTEAKLFEYLKELFPSTVYQMKFEWCKNPQTNKYLPFDFYIPELNLIIELDGQQHFTQVMNWESPELIQERDIYKMKQCINHHISVIRLLQDDVWNDKNNWKDELQKTLINHIRPCIIFLSNGNEYDIYDI